MIVRLALVVGLVAVATLLGRWWQSRQGRVHAVADGRDGIVAATLVSTPTCRTCPQVRRALDVVAASADAFSWDEVDAADDPAFVRTHDVMRAPTVLFRAADGRVVARAAGAMGPTEVAAAIGVDLVTAA